MNRAFNFAVIAMTAVIMANSRVGAAVVNVTEGSTSGYTMTDGNTYVIQNSVSFSNSTAGGSGMTVEDGATVVIYVPTGVTLTATGANGSGQTGGGAGIRVPETATIVITGEGSICVTGGDAGDGTNGENSHEWFGGAGGDGGGGGGTGIGGIGGLGGKASGGAGGKSESMGNVYVLGAISVSAFKGQGGSAGRGGSGGSGAQTGSGDGYYYTHGGGGGGGGAGSPPLFAIGSGGSAGGAGGQGRNGSYGYGHQSYTGKGGEGGGSRTAVGGNAGNGDGYTGGSAGAEGDLGTLYVLSTATVNVDREKLSATTHPAAQYTITFDANGGQFSSAVDSLTATLGCELPDCIPTPTRRGYLFDGWRTMTDEEYYGTSGTKSISSYPVAGNVILYAQWHWNDNVDYTVTTPEAVPYSYFDTAYPMLLAEYGGDYEVAAKATAANGRNKVWECYVAGISPTNETAKFTAAIEMVDGVPQITWSPNLNTNGVERTYTIWGKTNLTDGVEWECPTNSAHRFFKVRVGML